MNVMWTGGSWILSHQLKTDQLLLMHFIPGEESFPTYHDTYWPPKVEDIDEFKYLWLWFVFFIYEIYDTLTTTSQDFWCWWDTPLPLVEQQQWQVTSALETSFYPTRLQSAYLIFWNICQNLFLPEVFKIEKLALSTLINLFEPHNSGIITTDVDSKRH